MLPFFICPTADSLILSPSIPDRPGHVTLSFSTVPHAHQSMLTRDAESGRQGGLHSVLGCVSALRTLGVGYDEFTPLHEHRSNLSTGAVEAAPDRASGHTHPSGRLLLKEPLVVDEAQGFKLVRGEDYRAPDRRLGISRASWDETGCRQLRSHYPRLHGTAWAGSPPPAPSIT